jgi:hypothetical protein
MKDNTDDFQIMRAGMFGYTVGHNRHDPGRHSRWLGAPALVSQGVYVTVVARKVTAAV